jgi:predicted DNA-binding antitoxin AbrB/MazE fold protein
MLTFDATFKSGVLQPKQPIALPDDTDVRVTVEILSPRRLTVGHLNAFLQCLPSLGDDAKAFAQEIRTLRAGFPAEMTPWD